MQKGNAKNFVFLNLSIGRRKEEKSLRNKLEACVQSELKLPVWSKNKQNKQAKNLKWSQFGSVLRCLAETNVNALQINQTSIQDNSNLRCNLISKMTNKKCASQKKKKKTQKTDLTVSPKSGDVSELLGKLKKKNTYSRLHTRDSQTGRPEAESWNLYF